VKVKPGISKGKHTVTVTTHAHLRPGGQAELKMSMHVKVSCQP
jgi:hypothetical protein